MFDHQSPKLCHDIANRNPQLVGGFNPSEQILVNWDDDIPNNYMEKQKCSSHHQPATSQSISRSKNTAFPAWLSLDHWPMASVPPDQCVPRPGAWRPPRRGPSRWSASPRETRKHKKSPGSTGHGSQTHMGCIYIYIHILCIYIYTYVYKYVYNYVYIYICVQYVVCK